MNNAQVITKAIFNYPNFGTPNNFPQHTAHSGQVVEVVYSWPNNEEDGENLFTIRASDGWTAEAWESELTFN